MVRVTNPRSFYAGPIPEATPLVFAQVLLHIRASVNCTDWRLFENVLTHQHGLEMSMSPAALTMMAPTYRLTRGPSADLLVWLEDTRMFTFPNGAPITATALLETFYGRRDANGDPVP